MRVAAAWAKIAGPIPLLLGGLWAQPDPAGTVPLVLPKIEINETIPSQVDADWRFARVAGFEVLSNVLDFDARPLITDLQKFDHALRIIYPATATRPAEPLGILLVHAAEFRQFEADRSRPKSRSDDREFGLFFRNSERSMIVVDVDADTRPIVESSTDPFRQLHRQYLRHLLAARNTTLPAWLEEGLAQAIADIELRGKWLTFGKVETEQNMPVGEQPGHISIPDFLAPNRRVTGLSFKQVFDHRSFLPFDQFFTARLPDGSAPSSESAWAKQAYAFVHFCLFGNKLHYREPLVTLAERLRSEPLSEELFTQCFGVNYATMGKELRAYVTYTVHKYQRYPLKPGDQAAPEPVEFRPATPAEAGLVRGDALLLAGHEADAHEAYLRAWGRGARTPDFLAALAASFARLGEKQRARTLADAAISGGATRPSAYVLQARLRLDDWMAPPAKPDGRLTDAQLATVLDPLFKARRMQPGLPETYELIAEAWAHSATPPKPDNLAVLDEGIRTFPRAAELLVRSCELYRLSGNTDKAASIARLGGRFASDPAVEARFRQLAAAAAPDSR